MNELYFDFLEDFVKDDDITDINYNGQTLWIDNLVKGRYKVDVNISNNDFENLCYKIANFTNKQFNQSYPILESETDNLRISILHKSVLANNYSLSIRKTPPIMRLNDEMLIKQKYANQEILDILKQIVINKNNIIISGLPGVGKTELLKYLTGFIVASDRVITIEDNFEIRYGIIHPNKDSVSIRVDNNFNYRSAIKASLRQRPNWLLLSEVRGDEVVELFQSISTGVKLISTIHSDDVKSIPKRMLHMFPGNEITNDKLLYMVYENIDYGISIKSKILEDKIIRYIDEIAIYFIEDEKFCSEIIYKKAVIKCL